MEKIFMLTVDGTSSGDYENSACSLLFKTRDEAVAYVDKDLIDAAINAGVVDDDADEEAISKALDETSGWLGDNSAQFRHGDAVIDYKIEEVGIPG